MSSESATAELSMVSTVPEGGEAGGTAEGAGGAGGPSALLLREQGGQMHELRERYHHLIYTHADKYLKQSQQAQLKLLRVS